MLYGVTDVQVRGKWQLFLDNLLQILFAPDFERNITSNEFIGDGCSGPHIDFLIIGVALDDFGRLVERSAATACPHSDTVDCPTHVADLHDSLR